VGEKDQSHGREGTSEQKKTKNQGEKEKFKEFNREKVK